VRVFVFELLSAGGAGDKTPADALLCEGLAMLRAIAADFARCPACRVSTILDRRLFSLTSRDKSFDGIKIHWSNSADADDEHRLFRSLAAAADATFVIAPETDGQLLERRKMVDACGGQFLGCSAGCIALCGDKLRLYEYFDAVGLPTIATKLFDTSESNPPFNFPVVIKPRQGAGSQDTYLVEDLAALDALRPSFAATFGHGAGAAIVQPFVAGRPLSASALVDSATVFAQVFPVGEQHLSDDGRFHYLGGRIPARGSAFPNVEELILAACRSISGLSGYVGFDLIQLADSERFVIVEVNPRLTTSYLGYRELAVSNLASRILSPNRDIPLAWNAEPVTFLLPGKFASHGHPSVHPIVKHKALLHSYGEPAT
jgi:hypothetical protein